MTAKVERGPRQKIVIVDDDVLIRETVRLALDHAGYYVIAVGESERALAVVRAEKPDLVIMDLYMPGFDGRELIRALNQAQYEGSLSVEWEDSGMNREHGAAEACDFVRDINFAPSAVAFDAAFEE